MAEKLTVQQLSTLNTYLKKHPNAKREDAIKLLFDGSNAKQTEKGVKVEHNKSDKKQTITLKSGLSVNIAKGATIETKEGKITLSKTGRYSVTGKDGKTKYYAANGTELNEKYFKQIESGNVVVKNSKGVAVDVNKRLQNRIARASKELKDSEDNQGWLGKSWSGFKNMTGVGDSSDKVREQLKQESKLLKQFNQNPQNRAKIFKQLTGLEYNSKNMQDFIDGKIQLKSEQKLDGYKEGQKVAVDVASDVASGVAAFGIYTAAVAAAPFTGGASIAVGVAAASVAGAGIKVAVKASDTIGTNRKYDSLGSDILMGSVNGFIAPLTAGAGGAVAKTFAVRTGVQVVKEAGKQGTKQVISQTTKNAVKQGFARTFKANLKESVLQPNNYKLVGGTFGKRLAAYGAEGAVDGGLSGGAYSGVETAKNGGSVGEVLQATAIGLGMGALMGGAMTSLAHGKGVITGNKGAGEVLEDTVDTSLAPMGREQGRGVDDITPKPKPHGAVTSEEKILQFKNKLKSQSIDSSENGFDIRRFTDEEIEELSHFYSKRPGLMGKLLDEKIENSSFYKYDFETIKTIMNNYDTKSGIIEYILKNPQKYPDIEPVIKRLANVDKKYAFEILERMENYEDRIIQKYKRMFPKSDFTSNVKKIIWEKDYYELINLKDKQGEYFNISPDVMIGAPEKVSRLLNAFKSGALDDTIKELQGDIEINFLNSGEYLFSSIMRDGRMCKIKITDTGIEIGNISRLIHKNGHFINSVETKTQKILENSIGSDNYTKNIYDNNGVLLRKDVIKPNNKRKGEFDITVKQRNKDGAYTTYKAGEVKMFGSKEQGMRSRRRLVSQSGETTRQVKMEGPKGRGSEYTILDENGKTLFHNKRQSNMIDENHYTSKFNGHTYDISFSENGISVTKINNNTSLKETIILDFEQCDKNLIPLYKKLPGDYLFELKKLGIKVKNQSFNDSRACYYPKDRTIYLNDIKIDDAFTFAHEFGHAMDHLKYSTDISKDSKFISIYNEELEKFIKNSGTREADEIDYFTTHIMAKNEVIAETNALISGLEDITGDLGIRSVVLQQNFPRTIAYLAKKLEAAM